MNTYIGCKIIKAEPMDQHYFLVKEKALPASDINVLLHGPDRPGYKVVYEDGYVSWSPKDVFERSYRQITEAEKKLITG
jgi:hypothetical protein